MCPRAWIRAWEASLSRTGSAAVVLGSLFCGRKYKQNTKSCPRPVRRSGPQGTHRGEDTSGTFKHGRRQWISYVDRFGVNMNLKNRGAFLSPRSEERRVGKECRSRW